MDTSSAFEFPARDSIQNEKDRDSLEASIDRLRDEKEALEMELSDERVKWLGVRSPGMPNGAAQADMGATSIRMLREDFRKMMRDRTAEGLKALRVRFAIAHGIPFFSYPQLLLHFQRCGVYRKLTPVDDRPNKKKDASSKPSSDRYAKTPCRPNPVFPRLSRPPDPWSLLQYMLAYVSTDAASWSWTLALPPRFLVHGHGLWNCEPSPNTIASALHTHIPCS